MRRQLAGRRVLIVDDDALLGVVLVDMLEELGLRISARCSDVGDALSAVAAEPPDAAILDLMVRDRLSYDVADALEAVGVPFVFITGHKDLRLEPRHARRPLIFKPLTLRQMEAALVDLLGTAPPRAASSG